MKPDALLRPWILIQSLPLDGLGPEVEPSLDRQAVDLPGILGPELFRRRLQHCRPGFGCIRLRLDTDP